MTRQRLVETFNTHRMLPDVVRALATGRDDEVYAVLQEIRHAVAHPDTPPQHMIVYGERGSGKSFLMRLVEIEVEHLVLEANLPLVCALLPEEQYNIKSAPQLLEAVAARVRGADWSASAYAFDTRLPAQAWDAAVHALHEALDIRFGAGRGVVVAMIENFDALSKTLFGAETLESSKKKSATTRAAIERRAAEERLREFMGRAGARFMLLATATGTVDLDYERPLFLAFKAIDLHTWDGDTCIAYFNKRRQLQGTQELTAAEAARARAIAEFIGGNPRLAQLLAEVLNSPDAHTIAQTLDALSDHLADYYRRRLDDLPESTAGLLDTLIRMGEPCSQSELAQRVGAQQHQIADAFRYLVQARLLSAARERNGHGTLYRVRDRLFVHFYRRRYGGTEQSSGLAPIVELLATFFSARERAELARRHLAAGEFVEARVFRELGRTLGSELQGYDRFRDDLVTGAPSKLWELAGLTPDAVGPARLELRDRADQACKHWGDVAQTAPTPLQRTAAKLLQARAAARLEDDDWAGELLEEARGIAETDSTTDARILAVHSIGVFSWHRLRDRKRTVEQVARLQEWVDAAQCAYPKVLALRSKAFCLAQLGQHQEAVAVSTEAAALAQQAGDVREQAVCLRHKAFSLGQLARLEEAIVTFDQATALAREAQNLNELAQVLSLKAHLLRSNGRVLAALETIQAAMAVADQNVTIQERQWIRGLFLQIAAQTVVPDVMTRLAQMFEETTTDDHWLDSYLTDVMAAVARAEVWPALQVVVREHIAWFANITPGRSIFDGVGTVWAEYVTARGRAETFAMVARDLPVIADVMQRIPQIAIGESSNPVRRHLRDLVAGVVAHCSNVGFLRDLAHLVVEVFGTDTEDEAQRLRAFADVHAAENKETVLQRLDPDLARAIRRMWDLPEPEDLLARRGRPKGR